MALLTHYPVTKFLLFGVLAFIAYEVIGGVLIYAVNRTDPANYLAQRQLQMPEGRGPDRIALVEEPTFSGQARLELVQKATKTIEVAYYSIQHDDTAGKAFYNALLQAADRNVKVRILIDGMVNMGFKKSPYRDAFASHPNIQVKFYEPFSPLKPWRFQNRLHDKILLIDGQMLLTGGRNVGERYYLQDDPMAVYDRDILLMRVGGGDHDQSALPEASAYYDRLWNSEFTELVTASKDAKKEEVDKFLGEARAWAEQNLKPKANPTDWLALSVPTKYMRIIHNPLQRYQKTPHILAEIAEAIKNAQSQVMVQSPYIIINNPMKRLIPTELKAKLTILTNSAAVSPNFFAVSGYTNARKDLAQQGSVYEYQGNGSLHGKSYIIDNHLSIVGTFNLDPRSCYLSTESMVMIESEEFAAILNKRMQDLIAQSLLVNSDLSYASSTTVPAKEISSFKKNSIKVFSYIIRPFVYML
ncbi:MAG TPA: phosphatidylserine/phosphatidylglycerophosphate/cardiolipin synthase family protein [Thiolinea sp.]|nr:phosphatidylserine/phosphatidylglycerophosphate/cardiolipin synthase family protein [Thiolinea sp.]